MENQKNFAGRYSAEVDRILERQGRAEEEGPPSEYDEMLSLAEQLAALDFADDSQLRRPLRHRLLSQLEESINLRRRERWWRRLSLPRQRRALGALTGLLALVVLVGWTPAGRAVAQAVEDFVLELRWPHTTVKQVSPSQRPTATVDAQVQFESELAAGQAWEFSFGEHNFAGCCYTEPVRDEVVSLAQAIDEAGFSLRLPSFLPSGYSLSQVRLLGVVPYEIFIIYDGPDGLLGIFQSLVGVTSEEHPSEDVAIVESRAVGVITDRTVEEVIIGSTQAALMDGHSLAWETDNISFRLIGPGLDTTTLVRIAESLAPAR